MFLVTMSTAPLLAPSQALEPEFHVYSPNQHRQVRLAWTPHVRLTLTPVNGVAAASQPAQSCPPQPLQSMPACAVLELSIASAHLPCTPDCQFVVHFDVLKIATQISLQALGLSAEASWGITKANVEDPAVVLGSMSSPPARLQCLVHSPLLTAGCYHCRQALPPHLHASGLTS